MSGDAGHQEPWSADSRLAQERRPQYDARGRAAGRGDENIGGDSTPSIFARYNVVDESDLHEAIKKVERKSKKG
jgi:hypothetical protein